MSWRCFYPSQALFFPFHSSAKTCWETTAFVETGRPSTLPLFLIYSSSVVAFSLLPDSIHMLIILFSPRYILSQYCECSSLQTKCCSSFAPMCKADFDSWWHPGAAAHLCKAQLCPFLSSAFPEVPSSCCFLESGLSIFSSKEYLPLQFLKYALKLLITPEQHMPRSKELKRKLRCEAPNDVICLCLFTYA